MHLPRRTTLSTMKPSFLPWFAYILNAYTFKPTAIGFSFQVIENWFCIFFDCAISLLIHVNPLKLIIFLLQMCNLVACTCKPIEI